MKKFISLFLIIILMLSFSACRKVEGNSEATSALTTSATHNTSTDTTAKKDDSATTQKSNSSGATESPETAKKISDSEEAIIAARNFLGEKDDTTGYSYSYQFDSMTDSGDYKVRVSWYIAEDERFSTCGFLIVTPDGSVSKLDW